MSDIVEIMNFVVDLASGVFTNKPSGAERLLRGESYHRVANNLNWITIGVEKRNISKLATPDKMWRAI